RGSKAFKAMVDMSLLLTRPNKGRVLTLTGEGRFPGATPESLRARLIFAGDGWFYEPLSDRGGGSRHRGLSPDELLLKALAEAGSQGLTYSEIEQIEGLSKHIAKRRLPEWLRQSKVTRKAAGTKTDPFRWILLPA